MYRYIYDFPRFYVFSKILALASYAEIREKITYVRRYVLCVGHTAILPSSEVRNLGGWFDNQLKMVTQITQTCKAAFFHNQFIYKQKFKCEDLSFVTQLFSRNYYLFKFDLKSGYHRIEIFPDHRKFLTFAWDLGTGVFRYFQFCVLPSGSLQLPIFLQRF